MKRILVATVLLASLNAQAQEKFAPHQISASAVHQLDSLFQYLDKNSLYNGNILVGVGGKRVASAAIGYANLATHERLTESSPFELASVSKQFTAVGVLKLVAAGKLKLEDRLETLFPEIPYKGITIRHLLNHTSGLPGYEELLSEKWDRTKIATNKDVLAMLVQHHPDALFPPGSKWQYSNTGYAMLGLVIDQVSGKPYPDYMKQEVFKPLGLEHTFVYMRRYAPKRVPGYAYGFIKDDKTNTYKLPDSIADYNYVRFLDGIYGDGTVNTTTADLLKWNNAVRSGKLLPPALWKEAHTAPVIEAKSTDYGMGWSITANPERGKVLRHTGGWPGYVTNNMLYVDKDVSLIYLGNKELPGYLVQETYDAVKNIVFGLPFRFPELVRQTEVTIDKGIYDLYVGTYTSDEMEGFELTIVNKEGQLVAQATGQGEIEIAPESATMFFVKDLPIKMEFKGASGKNADVLVLHQNGVHEFKRKL